MSAPATTTPNGAGEEVIDGTLVGERRPDAAVVLAPAPVLAVTPTVKADELVARLDVIKQAMATAMVDGVDYGRIPGAEKPSLFKPGAEKLAVLFQFDVQTVTEKEWGPGEHLTVEAHTTVYHAPTGHRLGSGEGLCTTREKKYAKRKQERECPACGAAAVIKGKAEFGGGWLCWRKRDGCGAKFADGDERIEAQPVGDVANPELPDCWNTVIKMAKKRAVVDAVLLTTGASAIFTQDVEDQEPAPPRDKYAEAEAAHEALAPRVNAEEVKALKTAAKGLRVAHIKLAMSVCGVTVPEPFAVATAFDGVPQAKATALRDALAGVGR